MPPSSAHLSRLDEASSDSPGSLASANSGKPVGNQAQLLAPFSKIDEVSGRQYHLDVVQQPKRARMCGFGDKVRHSAPEDFQKLMLCSDIDHSMFVLNVDLWSEDGSKEVNLVRSSAGSPSASTPHPYTTLNGGDTAMVPCNQSIASPSRDSTYNPTHGVCYVQEYQMQASFAQTSPYPRNGSYGPPQQYYPQHQPYQADGAMSALPSHANATTYGRSGSSGSTGYVQDHNSLGRMSMVGGQPQGMFTRNLIGSLAASAFRLSDTEDRIGIWFVLQDLSVRTEGPFRLRFSFVNVGQPDGAPRDGSAPKVNKSRAPILACCFSEIFNVYSAKKFPGVCESTPLSKTFATQGIKIPIRKDANVKVGDDDDYGD
ncbi:uncharacterized protein UV8b_04876 [Ustilaginoidea virens]|uniref:Velvet domain-containing protein n=1 Tax=Ustilaginoidea virens TaxID=1159556 RepID=A0A8E5HS55_USTVR|nr:uncharacterized protein UV8b_04876 [Ustilaginoidea virens]QUC20635.1 hypothetical protein UV8b_04876 [Ustilaginoidea virens]